MSGIAGIVYPDPFQVNDLIDPMLDPLQRGGGEINTHVYACCSPG